MKNSPPMRTLLLASSCAIALSAGTARAQSVDYGALEQLFGEPVTTSATGEPQKVSEAPVTMEIITQDDIRRSGADNIPDILQFVSGVDVRRNAFGSADVAVRGYNQPNNPHLLVLLNGRQVYFDDYGYVAWNTIPVELDEIRQIEVVKGPNSALFGFNAASGVINIITYDPLSDDVNRVSAQTGTQKLVEGSAVTTAHAYDIAGMRISAGGYLAHEFEHPSDTDPINPDRGSISADGKARVAPGVEIGISASDSDSETLTETPESQQLGQAWRANSVGARVAADTRVGLLNFNVYRNEVSLHIDEIGEETNDVYVVQANDLVRLSAESTVRVGVEYRNNSVTSGTGGQFAEVGGLTDGTVGYQVWAQSLMWNWEITPGLSLTNAVRLDEVALNKRPDVLYYGFLPNGYTAADYNNRGFVAPSYNSGLVYKLTDSDTLRLMASRGLQMPALIILGYALAGNPDLNPTAVGNYELGYDKDVAGLSSTLRASVFYQTQDDIIGGIFGETPVLTPSGQFLPVANNVGSSHEFGIELGLKGHSDSGFRWGASYSFATVTDNLTLVPTNPPTSNLDYQHGTPEHMVKLLGGYSVGKWEFDAAARWQSSWTDYRVTAQAAPPADPTLAALRVPNYLSMNARIGYRLTDSVTLSGTAEQFNQAHILTSSGLPNERRFLVKLSEQF